MTPVTPEYDLAIAAIGICAALAFMTGLVGALATAVRGMIRGRW